MSQTIDFKYGSETNFDGLSQKEAGTVYFVKDDTVNGGTIYRGAEALGTTVSDKLLTSEPITVAGLSGTLGADYNNGDIIPAGTPIQSILLKLLSKEIWPTTLNGTYSNNNTTMNVSMGAPSVTNPSWASLVEVGTKLSIGGVTTTAPTASSVTAPTLSFSGFQYGYLTQMGSGTVNNVQPPTVTATVTFNQDVVYTLSRTYVGWSDESATTSTTGKNTSMPSFTGETLTTVPGTNSVKYTLSAGANTHTASVKAPSVYYAMSNFGNTNKDGVETAEKSLDKTSAKSWTGKPSDQSSSTFSTTAVYPVYNNNSGNTMTIDCNTKMTLADSATYEIQFNDESGALRASFAFPSSHSVTKIELYNTNTGKWDTIDNSKFSSKTDAGTKTVGGVEVAYSYISRVSDGADNTNKYRFTLNKKTSVA